MGEWTRTRHETIKACYADHAARGEPWVRQEPQGVLDMLAEIERGWAEIERLSGILPPALPPVESGGGTAEVIELGAALAGLDVSPSDPPVDVEGEVEWWAKDLGVEPYEIRPLVGDRARLRREVERLQGRERLSELRKEVLDLTAKALHFPDASDGGPLAGHAAQVWRERDEAHAEIARLKAAPVEAWAQRAADVVCAVPIDDLVRAGLASEDPAVTFEELEADHDLGSLRAAHERARAVILAALRAVEPVLSDAETAEIIASAPGQIGPRSKPFPMPGTVWRFLGNDMAPPSGPHTVTDLRWCCDRTEALFGADSCASVEHMMGLDAWVCEGLTPIGGEVAPAQPSPEKDNQIKRLATLSVALISARAANTRLERAMQRFVATRPSVGAWFKTDGCWSLYDDRGVCVAHISCPFAWDGIQRYHWYATRPFEPPARNQERTLEEAKKAVLAVLSTWADIGSVS